MHGLRAGLIALVVASAVGCGGKAPSATSRANRVIEMQRRLGIDAGYSRPALIASLASGVPPMSCSHADDDAFHSNELSVAKETFDHWLRYEAGFIAGACPSRLGAFFASLERVGSRVAVAQVRSQLKGIGAG
jgi:hypothetical protein